MSSPAKKTPQKREREVPPRQRTPIRTNLVTRAVTIQARKIGETPDDKKQERETRKTEDTLTRRRGTPRRKKIEEDKESEEDKQDEENVQTSESDADTADTEVKVLVEESQAETISNAEAPPNHKDERPTTIKVDKIPELKEDTVSVKKDSTVQPSKEAKDAVGIRIKKEDEELKRKEEELATIYNKLWEEENQQRDKIQERERRRRAKASRKIDQEYERLLADLYSRPKDASKSSTTSTTSTTSSVIDAYSSVKVEVESDEEDVSASEARVSKLEKELAKLQASLEEKEKLLAKLQKTPNDAMQIPTVLQAVVQLEEKRRQEEKTFTDGRKDLEDRLRKLQQENEKAAAELASQRQKAEKLASDKKEWERTLEERRKNLETRELAFAKAVSDGVRKKIHELKEQRRNQSSTHAQEQEPVVVDNAHENEEVSRENDNLQEPDGEQNPELPEENEYVAEENQEQNADNVSTQLDNSTDTDNPEAGDSPDRVFQSGRKRVRIEDDEDGGQQFNKLDPEDAAVYDIEPENIPEEGEEYETDGEPASPTLYRRILRPYARIAGVVAATAIGLPLVHFAGEIAQYLPQATGL